MEDKAIPSRMLVNAKRATSFTPIAKLRLRKYLQFGIWHQKYPFSILVFDYVLFWGQNLCQWANRFRRCGLLFKSWSKGLLLQYGNATTPRHAPVAMMCLSLLENPDTTSHTTNISGLPVGSWKIMGNTACRDGSRYGHLTCFLLFTNRGHY